MQSRLSKRETTDEGEGFEAASQGGGSRTSALSVEVLTMLPSPSFTCLSSTRVKSIGALCFSTAALMAGRSASLVTGQAYRK